MTIRLHVLARNLATTVGFNDIKSYQMGSDANPNLIGPFNDAYKRHAFTEVVRVTNVSQRKEKPLCRAPTKDCPP